MVIFLLVTALGGGTYLVTDYQNDAGMSLFNFIVGGFMLVFIVPALSVTIWAPQLSSEMSWCMGYLLTFSAFMIIGSVYKAHRGGSESAWLWVIPPIYGLVALGANFIFRIMSPAVYGMGFYGSRGAEDRLPILRDEFNIPEQFSNFDIAQDWIPNDIKNQLITEVVSNSMNQGLLTGLITGLVVLAVVVFITEAKTSSK